MLNNSYFQTVAHAKCIISGEHTVIRGGPALVMPIQSKQLLLSYYPGNQPLKVDAYSASADTFLQYFWNTLEKGLDFLHRPLSSISGEMYLANNIEMGSGIGFSAAICVVLTRWLIWEHWLKAKKMLHFSRQLECLFHGNSSGLDIVGAMAHDIVHFTKTDIHTVSYRWQPKLYLSYSGIHKNTKASVDKVNTFTKHEPMLARQIDQEMQESVLMIEEALKLGERHGMPKLISAIEHANHCFQAWGLVTPELQTYMDDLKHRGAIATKPTGAGQGGYVLSLWLQDPIINHQAEGENLIALFTQTK